MRQVAPEAPGIRNLQKHIVWQFALHTEIHSVIASYFDIGVDLEGEDLRKIDVSVHRIEGYLGNNRVGLRRYNRHGHRSILPHAENAQCGIRATWSASGPASTSAVARRACQIEGLRKPHTQCWYDHALYGILPVIDDSEATANHRPAGTK